MNTQSEQVLENDLVKQLTGLDYEYVQVSNEDGMLANLNSQQVINKAETAYETAPFQTILLTSPKR